MTIIKLDSGTLTNVSELVLADLSANVFKYEIVFSGLVAISASQTNLVFRTSVNNGATFNSSGDAYSYRVVRSSGAAGNSASFSGTVTGGQLINGVSNNAGNLIDGTIEIFGAMNALDHTTTITRSNGRVNADSNTSNPQVQNTESQREASEANNALRIFALDDGGTESNFSMQYTVYGYLANDGSVPAVDYQPLDATLTALAGVTTDANKIIYSTGVDTFATNDITSTARGILAGTQPVPVSLGGTGETSLTGSVVLTTNTGGTAINQAQLLNGNTIAGVGGAMDNVVSPPAAGSPGPARIPGRNLLRNGDFSVFQRGQGDANGYTMALAASTTAYTFDRWQFLTNANQAFTIIQYQATLMGTIFGYRQGYAAGFKRNSGQTGTGTVRLCQTIPSADIPLRMSNAPICLSFSTAIGPNFSASGFNITAKVYYGTGTTDESGLNGGLTTGGTIIDQTESAWNSGTTHHVMRGTAPGTFSQLAVEISWTPSGTAGDDALYIWDIQLEIGANPTPFDQKNYDQNLIECLPFYQKSFSKRIQPAQDLGTGTGEHMWPAIRAAALTNTCSRIYLSSMYATPTITLFNPESTNGEAYDLQAAADCSSTTAVNVTTQGFNITTTGNASTLVGNQLGVHWTAESEIT